MRLRNKKTGEIGELQITEKHCAVAVGNGTASCGIEIYSSLAELNKDWEDVPEEPKKWFTINKFDGLVQEINDDTCAWRDEEKESIAELGFRFKTKEEAELAVRKLKAWKRLKDKGFEFERWTTFEKATGKECFDKGVAHSYYVVFTFRSEDRLEKDERIKKDLDICFGGEE